MNYNFVAIIDNLDGHRRNGAARDAVRSGGDTDAHNFQEYTYKKITPCDICSQVLRGK